MKLLSVGIVTLGLALSGSASATKSKQDKIKASQAGKQKAKERKELTGRDHQGNHDSLTKTGPSGGSKSDKHANGVRQNGAAGQKK